MRGLFFAAVVMAGCGTGPARSAGNPQMFLDGYVESSERGDPSVRLEKIERDCRSIDLNYEEEEIAKGLNPILYPLTTAIQCVWQMVELGRDYETTANLSAAARAYWDALEMIASARASRRDREMLREVAFEQLGQIAEQRGQPRWASVLHALGGMARVYAGSEQGKREERAYRKAVGKLVAAHKRAEEAREDAERAESFAMLGAMTQVIGGQASGDAATVQAGWEGVGAASSQGAAAQDAWNEFLESAGAGAAGLRTIVVEDVQAVEAGQSFLAQEIIFYVSRADPAEIKAYLVPLMERWGAVADAKFALIAVRDAKTPDQRNVALASLGDWLSMFESDTAKYERRGRTMPAGPARPTPPATPEELPPSSPAPSPVTPVNARAPAALDIKILSDPSGAHVYRDNVLIGLTPFVQVMPPLTGVVTYVVTLEGFDPTKIEVRGDQAVDERVVLFRTVRKNQDRPAKMPADTKPAAPPATSTKPRDLAPSAPFVAPTPSPGRFYCTSASTDPDVAACGRIVATCQVKHASITKLTGAATPCAGASVALCFDATYASGGIVESCHPTMGSCAKQRALIAAKKADYADATACRERR